MSFEREANSKNIVTIGLLWGVENNFVCITCRFRLDFFWKHSSLLKSPQSGYYCKQAFCCQFMLTVWPKYSVSVTACETLQLYETIIANIMMFFTRNCWCNNYVCWFIHLVSEQHLPLTTSNRQREQPDFDRPRAITSSNISARVTFETESAWSPRSNRNQ